ncbi:MAG: nucleotidyltransferase domain-containing protein [Spirochaetales bacterium]|uniref:Nucleotidyltransferase domain-containing protein n=1 Tax=Candidatus Thalassospirochaeta sargassi TaxID=3119039 RepID=A0AAJ1IBK1_9SPIO|nr:nucleotidyltransferase domain-containing protein [Spirochaetales bacterium]
MRLNNTLRKEIISSAKDSFGDVSVYLFGSRTDDTKKGGDIDLAIMLSEEKAVFRQKKIKFLTAMMRRGFDYPFDIVQYNSETTPLLRKEIDRSGILLK